MYVTIAWAYLAASLNLPLISMALRGPDCVVKKNVHLLKLPQSYLNLHWLKPV